MTGFSRTSVWTALGRAVGARERDPGVRNPDFLAEKLLGPEERAVLGAHPLVKALDSPDAEAIQSPEVLTAARSMIPRTHFIDRRLKSALGEGATQLVILGAGFDSRAYRMRELLANVRVFEVDYPATQERKMRRVREALGDPPPNLAYVAVDFRTDDLGKELENAGYDRAQRTFFIWEGVTMYLPADAVVSTLRWVARYAPQGSSIVFDYTYETTIRVFANPDAFPMPAPMREWLERFRRLTSGEPWIFGIPDGKEEEFLSNVGLQLQKVLGLNSLEAVESYLTRNDGTVYATYPATERQGYLILEARVA